VDYQDVLALLGASHAHPGGRMLTRQWLDRIIVPADTDVLEVGCGTGSTLVWLQEKYGCRVVGVDIRPRMVELARERASQAGANAVFLCAPAEALPFDDNSYDLVYTESVNVFLEAPKALREYHRVLKPGGRYIDVEMMVLWPVDERWRHEAARVYGITHVPDQRGWKRWYEDAGFTNIEVLVSRPVRLEDMMGDGGQVDPGSLALRNPEVIKVLRDNAAWMERNHPYVAYGVFSCQKGSIEGTTRE
jgi:SAM-dependent methyltransferase